MKQVRTYLDRYPAKMVAHFADRLIEKYLDHCVALLDPFCGSGAILVAGQQKQIPVFGLDINPYAVILSRVKLEGFEADPSTYLCQDIMEAAKQPGPLLPINWESKNYWFTEATIRKYERIRYIAAELNLNRSRCGRAILLAYALSIRRCSRADQRSPKPFISKQAIATRKGRHFDPIQEIPNLLKELIQLYTKGPKVKVKVFCHDLAAESKIKQPLPKFSHIVTSPPYINAQDYFRNFKLELHFLEDLLPFKTSFLQNRFIGTERGDLIAILNKENVLFNRELLPVLMRMEKTHPRLALVIHRYLADMSNAFDLLAQTMQPLGTFVLVCGDNLVGGYRIPTWRLLNQLLENRGFVLFDSFGDSIARRNVPPQRQGHKGLIKQEVVSAFRLN